MEEMKETRKRYVIRDVSEEDCSKLVKFLSEYQFHFDSLYGHVNLEKLSKKGPVRIYHPLNSGLVTKNFAPVGDLGLSTRYNPRIKPSLIIEVFDVTFSHGQRLDEIVRSYEPEKTTA